MVLTELNKDDCARSARCSTDDRQVVVEHSDGYQALKAFLPPQRAARAWSWWTPLSIAPASSPGLRGAGLGPPPLRDRRLCAVVSADGARRDACASSAESLATGIRKILQLELSVLPESWTASLRGCGMLVVNPPFGFEEEARVALAWLWQVLSPEREGRWRVNWLTAE